MEPDLHGHWRGTFEQSTSVTNPLLVIGSPILAYSKVADFWTAMLQACCSLTNRAPIWLVSIISAHHGL